jgi:hypothetical protein
MSWTLSGTRIYTTDMGGNTKQIIARLNPLGGGTIKQIFGYDEEILQVKAYVVGEADLATIKGYAQTGLAYTLSGYSVNYGNYYVSSVQWSRVPAIYQTLTSNCDDPLFSVSIDLYPST